MPGQRAFSHILFDLDHTLSYYPVPTSGVVASTFERLGLPLDRFGTAEELALRYDALWVALERDAATADDLRLAVWQRILAERELAANELARCIAAEYGALRRATGVRLIDGVDSFLTDLRAAGYGLGLLTNGISDGQWEKIRALRIEPAFDAILVAGDVGVYKPNPQAFLTLLGRLGASPSGSLFVGDSYESDVLGAHAAGIATAWVRPEGTEPLGDVRPRFSIAAAADLREVLL